MKYRVEVSGFGELGSVAVFLPNGENLTTIRLDRSLDVCVLTRLIRDKIIEAESKLHISKK